MMMKVHALIGALLVLFASETWAVRIVTPAGDEVTVGEGDSLTLTCEDDMDAIDTWKLNGMRLEGNDDYTITTENEGKTSMLTIKQASSASQGRFVCEVDIFTNAEIRVHVEEGDQESVTIVEPDTDSKTITVGEQLNMKCTGGPGVTLLWYHRGMQVTTDSGLVVTSARDVETNKATSLLSVRKVSEEDGGNYECKDESDPLFNVDAVNIKIAADDGDNTVEMFSPSSNMLTVEPEHIISLKCRAPRNTVIVWFKDDAQLTEDDGIISVAEEGDKVISMLTVEDADEEDAGEYACVNEADESDKDYIDVQIGGSNYAYSGPRPTTSRTVIMKIGSMINLECTGSFHATSAHVPQWAKGDQTLPSDSRKYTITINPNASSLKIRNSDVHDVGLYTCSFVEKGTGAIVGAILFNVTVLRCERPSRPMHGHFICPRNPLYGDTCSFYCTPGYKLTNDRPLKCEKKDEGGGRYTTHWSSSIPHCKRLNPEELEANVPTSMSHVLLRVGGEMRLQCKNGVKWKKNGYYIYNGLKYTITGEYLIIKYTDKGDKGTYDCNIQPPNSVLSGIKKFNVTTLPCPRLPQPINGSVDKCSVGPVYGETCVFRCLKGGKLKGSKSRTCELLDGQSQVYWTGEQASCKHSVHSELPLTAGASHIPAAIFTHLTVLLVLAFATH